MDKHKEEHRGYIVGFYSIEVQWDHWAGKPTLTAKQAIPLINGCDPKSWEERDSRDDSLPGDMIAAIEMGLEIAEGEEVKSQSPADWLAWGKRHGLDQPTMRSDDRLRLPDVSMWPFFADAVEKAVQPETKKAGKSKAPPKFLAAFNRLLCEIEKRSAAGGLQLDKKQMPGTKENLLVVAREYEPRSMTVELQTFDEYIAGVVSFKKGRPPTAATNPYAGLFPEYFT